MAKLKTLEEHNNEVWKKTASHTTPFNGIACPECGKELYDTNPGIQLLCNPPRVEIACVCGFRGTRVA